MQLLLRSVPTSNAKNNYVVTLVKWEIWGKKTVLGRTCEPLNPSISSIEGEPKAWISQLWSWQSGSAALLKERNPQYSSRLNFWSGRNWQSEPLDGSNNLRTFEEGTQELDKELRLEPAQNPKPTDTAFHQCVLLKNGQFSTRVQG